MVYNNAENALGWIIHELEDVILSRKGRRGSPACPFHVFVFQEGKVSEIGKPVG